MAKKTKIEAYALRYNPTGKFIQRAAHPAQVEELEVECLFKNTAEVGFARSQLAKEHYDCSVTDIEVLIVHVTLKVGKIWTRPSWTLANKKGT